MNLKSILIISFTLCLLFSCKRESEKADPATTIHFANQAFTLSAQQVECEFIPLETTSDNLIGSIGFVQIVDDRIFVLDKGKYAKLLVFGIDGGFITQIGSRGGGPGEYTSPTQFMIDKKENLIAIADGGENRLLYYDLTTYAYTSSYSCDNFNDCTLLENGDIAWHSHSGYDLGKRKSYNICITDNQISTKNYYNEADFTSPYSTRVSGGKSFHQKNGHTYMHALLEPIVWEINPDGIDLAYELDFGKAQLPPLDFLKEKAPQNGNYVPILLGSEYIASYSLYETDEYMGTFYLKQNVFYIGFCHKKSNQGWTTPLIDFIKACDLPDTRAIYGVHNNYFIISLSPEAIKKGNTKRANLQSLTAKVNEDDNPILCLIKINADDKDI